MDTFRRILVDVDVTAPIHPALERAIGLAKRCGATVTIADVLTIPPHVRRYLPANLEQELLAERRERLASLLESVREPEMNSVHLMGRPATVLVQEVLRSGHDLIVRAHDRGQPSPAPRPFGAVDMELLRECPCPVFLIGRGVGQRVVGAVNASTEERSEREMNAKIVQLTLLLAELQDGEPALLQAWSPFAELMVRTHSSEAAYGDYVEETRRRTAADLTELAESAGRRSRIRTVHLRGEPEDVIPAYVKDNDVDSVVMGTMARTGIAGLLIGNTAERVLSRLTCSALAVKPDGFVSPIGL